MGMGFPACELGTAKTDRGLARRRSFGDVATNSKRQDSRSDLEGGILRLRIGCQMRISGTMSALIQGQNSMRHIDIDSLSEDELIELNHKIVARLRFLSQMRSHSAMLDFRVGERVKFHPDGNPELVGTLIRYNKRTVTVVTDAGQHWNVSPSLLSKANPPGTATSNANDAGVVRFPDRSAEK
jgi:hypothetical protein